MAAGTKSSFFALRCKKSSNASTWRSTMMKHVRSFRHTMLVVFFMYVSTNIFPQTAPQQGQRDSRLAAANKRQQIDDILTRFTAFGFSGTVLVAEKGKV